MDRICERCGGASFHFNQSRMRMECSLCGHPIIDPRQEQQRLEFDRTYNLALGHLQAGNWGQVISMLQPYLNQYPTDKRIYAAILRAATHDYNDINMEEAGRRTAASNSWDKLVRLNEVNNEMIRYSQRRYEMHMKELHTRKNNMLAWIFSASFCAFATAILLYGSHYYLGNLCFGAMIFCVVKFCCSHPAKSITHLSATSPNYRNNPFE